MADMIFYSTIETVLGEHGERNPNLNATEKELRAWLNSNFGAGFQALGAVSVMYQGDHRTYQEAYDAAFDALTEKASKRGADLVYFVDDNHNQTQTVIDWFQRAPQLPSRTVILHLSAYVGKRSA